MYIKRLPLNHFEKARKLFINQTTNLAAALGVIEGLIPGDIWVDNINNPNACLIICHDSYCLMAGEFNPAIMQDMLILLKQKQTVRLACEAQIAHEFNLLNHGFTKLPRCEYQYQSLLSPIPYYPNQTGFIIKPIQDESTVNLCLWKQLIYSIYQDANIYLKHGLGFILWDNDKQIVVSEAHGFCSQQFIEIATITHEHYRGQQLATIVCNHLIHAAIKHDLTPIWSCDADNVASKKLAINQGMDKMMPYVFYALND